MSRYDEACRRLEAEELGRKWGAQAARELRDDLIKRERRRLVRIEKRAAELAYAGGPPRLGDADDPFTTQERIGWAIHYWNQYARGAGRREAPTTNGQEAGWLARQLWLEIDKS